MPKKIEITRHISPDDLENLYHMEDTSRMKERLHAILLLYKGYHPLETSKILGRSYASIKRWKRAWNAGGYDKLNPDFKGGYEPQISSSTWDEIIKYAKDKAMTLQDVQVYVNTEYGANYTYSSVWYWVRRKKKVPYGKPYPRDIRRPENAPEILKKPRRNTL